VASGGPAPCVNLVRLEDRLGETLKRTVPIGGLFADEADWMDQVVSGAMAARSKARRSIGGGRLRAARDGRYHV
jgi:hypothetical protein